MGPEFPPLTLSHSLFMLSEGLVAKVNDLASRQHPALMEVCNFSLGNNFVVDRLIYILVIKFKTHKILQVSARCVFNAHAFVYVWLCDGVCECILYKHNSPMPHVPKSHHHTLCVYCIVSVISHTFL